MSEHSQIQGFRDHVPCEGEFSGENFGALGLPKLCTFQIVVPEKDPLIGRKFRGTVCDPLLQKGLAHEEHLLPLDLCSLFLPDKPGYLLWVKVGYNYESKALSTYLTLLNFWLSKNLDILIASEIID